MDGRPHLTRPAAIVALAALMFVAACGSSPTPAPASAPASAAATPSPTAPGSTAPGSTAPGSTAPSATEASTPEPTASPSPTPPTVKPLTGSFKSISKNGKGNATVKFSIPAKAMAIASFTETGGSSFSVTAQASDGTVNDQLISASGAYSGTVLVDARAEEHSVAFGVKTKGTWSVIVAPVAKARMTVGSATLKGLGDDVVLLGGAAKTAASARFTHKGSGSFTVTTLSADGQAEIVHASGTYDDSVQLSPGVLLFEIRASGAWTVTLK